ncbi:hypothetical protein Tco_0394927 [Tanacetum coccineum]
MIELRAHEELKDTIMVAMPILVSEGACPKKIVSDVVKNLNNPRQATRGVPIGPNVSFKSTKQIYRPISNKNGASSSGTKKQVEVSRQEVSNLNLSRKLNSIENNDDLLIEGKLLLVNDDGKPLPKVVSTVNVDSDSEVEEAICDEFDIMIRGRKKKYIHFDVC